MRRVFEDDTHDSFSLCQEHITEWDPLVRFRKGIRIQMVSQNAWFSNVDYGLGRSIGWTGQLRSSAEESTILSYRSGFF